MSGRPRAAWPSGPDVVPCARPGRPVRCAVATVERPLCSLALGHEDQGLRRAGRHGGAGGVWAECPVPVPSRRNGAGVACCEPATGNPCGRRAERDFRKRGQRETSAGEGVRSRRTVELWLSRLCAGLPCRAGDTKIQLKKQAALSWN